MLAKFLDVRCCDLGDSRRRLEEAQDLGDIELVVRDVVGIRPDLALQMQRRCHCQSIGAGSGALPGQSVRLPRPTAQHALDFGRLAPVLRLCVGCWVDAAALIAVASYREVVRPPPTAPMVLENGHSDFLTVMPMASRSAIAASWTVDR